VDELTGLYLISHYFQSKGLSNVVVVAADEGATKRARNVAQSLNGGLAIIEKRRVGNEEKTEALNVIGDVEGREAILVDDEVLTGGTLVEAAKLLIERGATAVSAACTHALLADAGVARLGESPIEELVVTDTVPIPPEKRLPNLTILSLAPLIGEAIRRIDSGQSVGELFHEVE
jgi:ribose-phosphate pyrophosphokinase